MTGKYVQIRPELSWHVVRTPTRMFDTYVTACGRRATGKPSDDYDWKRVCGSCFIRVAMVGLGPLVEA